MKAFNEALDQGLPEDEASAMAWAAVKRAGYSKTNGKWSKSMDELESNLTLNDDGTFVLGAPLIKIDVKKRIVSGFATLDNVDEAGDRLKADASEEAFSKWFGNIREMHQKKAVGKAIDWKPDTYTDEETGKTYEGVWVSAKISKGAEDTWQKVLDGTLSGFSVGGATLEKQRDLVKDEDGNSRQIWTITKYRLTELSLVDNPCNRLATISLIKSVDGNPQVEDTVADEDIEKVHNGETGEFVDFSEDYRGVVRALESLRDRAISESADYVVAEASEKLACFRSKAKWESQDADYHNGVTKSEDTEEAQMGTEVVEKSQENLQENENPDIPSVELTKEERSIFQKFVDFIKNEETATPDVEVAEDEKEGVTSDMNEEEVTKAITEAGEELTKGIDGKFDQLGESLTKIAGLLEKVATAESVTELEKSFDEKVAELATRLDTVEKSGGVQKSGEEAGESSEKIEKSDEGFWSDSILPEFLQNR